MTSALHLLLLSFILLLVRPTTGDNLPGDYYDVPDYEASREYYNICERYTEGEYILDRIRGDAEKFGALKSKISKKFTYTDPAKLLKNSKRPYRELDNAIRSDLITLVAKSERRARETSVLASENGENDIMTILENGYKDIERYCDMAKQVQAISYYIKKADRVESIEEAQRTAPRGTKGGFTLNGWDYGTVWDALEEFKRKSGYNEADGEEENYHKEDYGLRGKYDGTKYEVAHKALEKLNRMRKITFRALAKMMMTCRAEARDQTIRGYASDFKDYLKDEEVKPELETAANDLEHVADTINKIWVVIDEDYHNDVQLQRDIMKILEADATLEKLESYNRLSGRTGPAEADKMLMDIDPIAKAIRDFVEEYEEFHHPVIAAFEAALAKKAAAKMTGGTSLKAQGKAKAHTARRNKGRLNRRRRQRARK